MCGLANGGATSRGANYDAALLRTVSERYVGTVLGLHGKAGP